MRNFNKSSVRVFGCLALASALLASCSKGAKVDGMLDGASNKEVIVKLLDVNKYVVLDTVKTDANGRFACKVDVAKGQPEFVYLFYGDRKVASLLLQTGDKVKVNADTLGTYSVTGSSETDKLIGVERMQAEFLDGFARKNAQLADMSEDSPESKALRQEIVKSYIDYYRKSVSYVMRNSHSLTVVPVLYQTIGEGVPVFGQITDAIHFRNICDSLKTVYPESRYVKALDEEAKTRYNRMELEGKLSAADEAGFMDVELPSVNGTPVRLSDVKSKVVMIYFWSAELAGQKMFNLDVVKPVYKDFHSKGLEIYAVSLDTDKALWAKVVKAQGLDWVNVCDGRGTASPSVTLYNVGSIPAAYFIVDGNLVSSGSVKDGPSLRAFLSKYLK